MQLIISTWMPRFPWVIVLREHLTQGYTLNRQRLETNARELEAALLLVRKAAQSPELQVDTGRGLVDIVTRYAQTFLLLQRYDEGLLTEPPEQRGAVRCLRRPRRVRPWRGSRRI